jgi:hypothetical protein
VCQAYEQHGQAAAQLQRISTGTQTICYLLLVALSHLHKAICLQLAARNGKRGLLVFFKVSICLFFKSGFAYNCLLAIASKHLLPS